MTGEVALLILFKWGSFSPHSFRVSKKTAACYEQSNLCAWNAGVKCDAFTITNCAHVALITLSLARSVQRVKTVHCDLCDFVCSQQQC